MYDVIVVGGGPAGLTAALYAARAGKDVLVLEGESTGGQIQYSPLVDNYPGLPGMSGAQFAQTLTEQVQALGVCVRMEAVTFLRTQNGLLELTTSRGRYSAPALVLATGVSHRKLGLPGEDDLIGLGVSYCAVCDGAFYQGRPVAVVGGGDTALQDALFLSGICSQVTLIHRREEFRGGRRLVEQVLARDNIACEMDSTVEELLTREGGLSGVTVRNRITGQAKQLEVEGLFIAVGQQPQNGPFSALIAVDEDGYLLAGEDCKTSLPGVFAAGDCRSKGVRQLTTAVGDGAVAGLAACRWVDEHPN